LYKSPCTHTTATTASIKQKILVRFVILFSFRESAISGSCYFFKLSIKFFKVKMGCRIPHQRHASGCSPARTLGSTGPSGQSLEF
jgi:hypothetical protein